MNSTQNNGETPDREAPDMLGQVIKQAGRRERPSSEDYDRVFTAAKTVWEARVGRRRRRVWYASLAASVAVGALVTVVGFQLATGPAVPVIATIERIVGPAEQRSIDDSGWAKINEEGLSLFAGQRIRTGSTSRLGVRMANGVSLRLAESTDVFIEGPGRVRLRTGKVYADSEFGSDDTSKIAVVTDAGLARDFGTQFEVQYIKHAYRLRVREGRVTLVRSNESFDNRAGEQLTIDADERVHMDFIAADDVDWHWVESVASAPNIDGELVSVLLRWVHRETGRPIVYTHADLEQRTETTVLHGDVHHLAPLDALEVMLATTDFGYSIQEDGAILIGANE
jgi:ferric-dicitrate binding protein FerR (iron transport regulator)